jgi:hypothetical protein
MIRKCRGTAKWALLLTLVMGVAASGCEEDGTGPDDQVAGRYELRTVNGNNLPYTLIALGNDRLEFLSGFAQVNADATFSVSFTTRQTVGGQTTTTTDSDSGTWTQTGSQMRFTFSDATVSTGVVSGDEITVIEGQVSFVFRK